MIRRRRSAFTVLEILLALAIGVILMAALYFAINLQMRTAQAGRQLTQQNTLVRSLFLRMDNDLSATVNLTDPARWRNQLVLAGSSSSGTSGTTTGTGTSSGTGTSTGTSTNTGTGTNTGTSGSSSSTTGGLFIGSTVVLPLGGYNANNVICDNQHLTVHVSRFPREAYQADPNGTNGDGSNANNATNGPINQDEQGIGASDLRCISYWYEDGKGLCRQEIGQATFDAGQTPLYQYDESLLVAPEVTDVTFTYFDGTTWQDQWDGTVLSADGINPIGSPRAIKILLTIQLPRDEYAVDPKAARKTKQYSHVILIPSANGMNPYNSLTGPNLDGGGAEP